jgi:XTP/dITP diphosphohydrolase
VRKIVIATRNAGKIVEIRTILQTISWEVIPIAEIVPDFSVVEDGHTYAENAIKKARAAAQLTHTAALADDSGLEVDALDGAPGVFSARFGGNGLSQAEKNALLLRKLQHTDLRSARFRCVIAVVLPDGTAHTTEGVCEGHIGHEPKGSNGFGYDPVFVLPEYDRTMAELEPAVKNRISHRAKALANLPTVLSQIAFEES